MRFPGVFDPWLPAVIPSGSWECAFGEEWELGLCDVCEIELTDGELQFCFDEVIEREGVRLAIEFHIDATVSHT
jgi:hypothetical protein